MNILLCTSELGNVGGGLALHCEQLKYIFEKMGHNVCVEIFQELGEELFLDGGYDSSLGNKLRISYALKEFTNKYKNKIDLCVSCGAGKTAYWASNISKSLKIPIDIVLCGSEVNLAVGDVTLAFYNEKAFEVASSVIGPSNEIINSAKLCGGNRTCQYYVIPNICSIDDNVTSKPEDNSRLTFATGASFLGEKKGISSLIRAFAILINEYKRNDVLYLFGRIDEDIKAQYDAIICENKLENNIIFKGYMSREEYHKEMENVDVYIQASPFEGFANSVAEAISLGKDILLSNTGFIPEYIIDEFPGHIISSLKPKNMAADIHNYITNIYPKAEADDIRRKIADLICERTVVNMWNQVLETTDQGEELNICDNCTAVMFHDVDCSYTGVDYAKEGFEKLIELVNKNGFRLCSAKDYFSSESKESLIICTFDDGYENVYKNAYPIMRKYGFSATVYTCPDLIGKTNDWNHKDEMNRVHMSDEMIIELVGAGWEIGSHGLSHMNLVRLSEHDLEYNLIESKKQLEKYGVIESFCYPYGSFNPFIKDKVKKYYKNAFSVSVGGNNYVCDCYQITRITPEKLYERLEFK